ncbi:MAG: hypothetical protein ACI391_01385 [Muribaculaceae bacterium]
MRRKDPSSLRIIDLWSFRSEKTNKRYIVEIEGFESQFYGIKFYWKGVEKSPNRYSLLTNDYEPRIIIRTCVEIMLHYYRNNPLASFGFVAAPDLPEDIDNKNRAFRMENRRYTLYKRLMLNWFGSRTFLQVSDTTSTIYLLVNKSQLSSNAITIVDIERQINTLYAGDYTF